GWANVCMATTPNAMSTTSIKHGMAPHTVPCLATIAQPFRQRPDYGTGPGAPERWERLAVMPGHRPPATGHRVAGSPSGGQRRGDGGPAQLSRPAVRCYWTGATRQVCPEESATPGVGHLRPAQGPR